MSRIIPDPVPRAGALPSKVDVVVIGGGIVGVCTALTLAERGVSVALCEKGLIGAEQSGRNWGWVRQMGRDPAELPLAIESLTLWKGMNERIGVSPISAATPGRKRNTRDGCLTHRPSVSTRACCAQKSSASTSPAWKGASPPLSTPRPTAGLSR
jgi:glycine/D-amino acid oxidase-like deaminating enzyme